MKRIIRIMLILGLPYIFVIFINFISHPKIKGKPYKIYGVQAKNTNNKNIENCTWICHNQTDYCKKYHVKYLAKYYGFTDPFYYGLINTLKISNNYVLMNIIFLVLLIPLVTLFFIIKSLEFEDKIRKLKK